MQFSRFEESQTRLILDLLRLLDWPTDPEAVIQRMAQLQRGLEPEDEFALILSWLGKCRLVHKLNQEQLPLASVNQYRVPDLLAAFDYQGKVVPVLIEVKTTAPPADPLAPGNLSLKPGYLEYATLLGLPMLIAWKDRSLWTLFEMRHAELAETNYHITFLHAMEESLLSVLAGDFSYRLAPATALRLSIRKLSPRDPETGGFVGEIHDTHFINPLGERVPDIPHLGSLFMFWENEAVVTEDGEDVIEDFVVAENSMNEFASRTLTKIVHAFAGIKKTDVNWRAITHDADHLAHQPGMLRTLVEAGAEHGIFTDVFRFKPQHMPPFLTED